MKRSPRRPSSPTGPQDGFCRTPPVRPAATSGPASPASGRWRSRRRGSKAPKGNPHARNSSDVASRGSAGAGAWSLSTCGGATAIERTCKIQADEVAGDYARRRSGRNRDDEANKAEQLTKRQQREHQPDRMQTDRPADELRRDHVAFEELSADDDRQRQEESFRLGQPATRATLIDRRRVRSDPT